MDGHSQPSSCLPSLVTIMDHIVTASSRVPSTAIENESTAHGEVIQTTFDEALGLLDPKLQESLEENLPPFNNRGAPSKLRGDLQRVHNVGSLGPCKLVRDNLERIHKHLVPHGELASTRHIRICIRRTRIGHGHLVAHLIIKNVLRLTQLRGQVIRSKHCTTVDRVILRSN